LFNLYLLPSQTNTRTLPKGIDGFVVSTQASETHAQSQTGNHIKGRWWAGWKVGIWEAEDIP
jgi:hypothetical protein